MGEWTVVLSAHKYRLAAPLILGSQMPFWNLVGTTLELFEQNCCDTAPNLRKLNKKAKRLLEVHQRFEIDRSASGLQAIPSR